MMRCLLLLVLCAPAFAGRLRTATKTGGVSVTGMTDTTTGYLNDWDGQLNYVVSPAAFITGMWSRHDNGKEDRLFKAMYRSKSGFGRSGVVHYKPANGKTAWDARWQLDCDNNEAIIGWESNHDNGREDRQWRIRCSALKFKGNKVTFGKAGWTGWANGWDQDVNFRCPPGTAMVGIGSVHDNGTEDRLWQFRCSTAVTYEEPNVDGCKGNPCGGNGQCVDKPHPQPGNTCKCNSGYEVFKQGNTERCKDINGCAGNPCGAGGTCVDKLAPQTGFTCKCKVGYAGNKCADINGCAGNKCKSKDQAAVCSDVKAPGVGNTCKCSNGFSVHKGASNTQECIDVNGCEGHTCNAAGDAKATCADVPAPLTGFTCKCSSGFSDEGDGKCAEINGCALPELGDPCKHGGDEGATCTDSKAPATGNTCTCSKGFKSEEKDGVTKCVPNDCLVAAEAAIKQIQGDVEEANTNVDNEATNWEEKARKCTLDQGSIDAAQKKLDEAEDDLEDAKQALSDAENAKLDSCKAGLSLGQLEKLMKDDAFPAQLGPNGAFADAYKAVEEAKKEADAAPKVVEKMKDVVAATTTAAQGAYETCKCDAKDGFDKAWQNAKESHEGTADERKNAMLREKKTICAAENAGKADACDNLELSAEDLASLDLTEPKFPADIELKCEAPATEAPTTDEPVTEAPEAPSSTEAPTTA